LLYVVYGTRQGSFPTGGMCNVFKKMFFLPHGDIFSVPLQGDNITVR
jgi:hypothetical protein